MWSLSYMNILIALFWLIEYFYNLQRSDIVQGDYEPTEEECDFPSDEEDDVKDLSTDMEGKVKLEESKPLVFFINNYS